MTDPTARTTAIRAHFEALAPDIDHWKARNRYYHDQQLARLRYLIGEDQRVLEIGCGSGEVLAALAPREGYGIDLSPTLIAQAQARHPGLHFEVADADRWTPPAGASFDYILLSDVLGYLDDIQRCLKTLQQVATPHTRIVFSFYNFLWQPVLAAAEAAGRKMPTPEQSWISLDDLKGLLELGGFDLVKAERRLLFPLDLPVLSTVLNELGQLPVLNHACLSHYVVARPEAVASTAALSVSIVVPCRNERGNIREAVTRLPAFGAAQEILFVDGHSNDGTVEEIERVIAEFPHKQIKLLRQTGRGKGDAVRLGFAAATGDVLMILDSDLTVPPEDLPKFYDAIASGKGEFINGCRLIYPMQDQAMRALNQLGNKFFALCFSWLLGQTIKDTLCGTKVLRRLDYEKIAANRHFFGDFDPFGDFDLLLGASKLNLKLVEVPVRYRSRTYGETKIHRFRHGFILLKMVIYAWRRIKARPG